MHIMVLIHKQLRACWEIANASRIITIHIITTFITIQYVLIANYYPPTLIMNPEEILGIAACFLFWTWIPDHSQNIVCASASCWKPLANYDLLTIWCTKIALAAKMQFCVWNGLMMLMKWINPEASGHPILSNIGSQYSVAVLNQIESHSCGVMTLGIE